MGFRKLEEDFTREIMEPYEEGKAFDVRVTVFWSLRLLFEIAGNLDTLAFCYRTMLDIQKERTNGPKT